MVSAELLRRFPFFNFMDDRQLKAVAMISEEKTYSDGNDIVETNKPVEKLFFILEGVVTYYFIVTDNRDARYKKEFIIGDFNPGEIFGISALIEPYVYTASVRVKTPCHLIEINASALRALCEEDVTLNSELMRAVAKAAMERLQYTRAQLIAAQA